jgi:hypothetical protein
MKYLLRLSVFALVVFIASGCSALRVLNPFDSVSAKDAEWSGIKSGEPVSVTASIGGAVDERAGLLATLLAASGQGDPLGVLMPLLIVGETAPRWVLCDEKLTLKCKQIPLNAEVKFAGRPIGPGLIWKPSRLTAANFND